MVLIPGNLSYGQLHIWVDVKYHNVTYFLRMINNAFFIVIS